MATRTSQPAGGALLISELKEFASFPKATQRYIRRSLDVAYGRSDPLETWARDEIEAAAIAAQLSLSVGTVKNVLCQSLKEMREGLLKAGISLGMLAYYVCQLF